MSEPAADKVARQRWMTINLVRLAGVVLVMLGVVTLAGTAPLPQPLGWACLGIGLCGVLLLPQALVRRWRTPRE